MKGWRIVTVLLLCLVLASSTACTLFGIGNKEEAHWQLAEVVRGDLTVSVSGSGNIDVSNEAKLTFATGGRVDRIYVKEGNKVSEGDVLVKLDTTSLELALTQAELALEEAELNLEEAELNLEEARDTGSLELALTQAELALKEAELNLEKAKEPYTEEDISNAEATIDAAEYYLEYAQWMQAVAGTGAEKRRWKHEILRAQLDLDIARQELETILSGPDEDEIAIAEMRVETAKQSLEQAQRQLDEATITTILEMRIEAAEMRVEAAKQSLEQAQKQLDEATITTPFDGIVANIGADEGDTISATTIIIHLIDPTAVKLPVQVDEIDIPKIKLNQRAVVSIDALPGVKLEGSVTAISPVPATTSGVILYDVTIALTALEGIDLKIGMSTTADIIIEKRSNILLVPTQAIRQDRRGNSIVMIQDGEQLQPRSVVTGLSVGLLTEIVEGLSEGETVVIEMPAEAQPSAEPSGEPLHPPGMLPRGAPRE